MAVHQRLPSNLTELERICTEEWQRIPKSRCEKLVASFPKRLMAVLNQKGASKYLGPCDISVFLFNKSAKMSTILCFSVNMGCCVYINEEKKELK